MQVQTVNKYAVRKYNEFGFAISQCEIALGAVELLIKKCSDVDKKFKSPMAATKDELLGFQKRAQESLTDLRVAARKYQIELQSKGWRV